MKPREENGFQFFSIAVENDDTEILIKKLNKLLSK
jgi:hypothetical protein